MVRSRRPTATPPARAASPERETNSGEALLRLASRQRDRRASNDNAKETIDPENVTDWDQLDVDINVKQVFQDVGLKPSQGARLIKSCQIQKEEDLISLTHSDIGSLGLQKLAERRFISLLQSWKAGGKGVGGKPEDTTKALNLLVTAGEKHNLQLVRDIVRSNNGKHVGVQQQACVTLRNMVAKDMQLREKAGQLGLLSDIQNAMRTYADSAGIQKQATGAIWNLVAGTPRNQEISGRINMLQELQTAMHNFEEHAEVQKMACGALWQLTLGHAMNKSKAGQQGMLQSLQKAMQRHPLNIDVQREACGAIRSLTSDNAKNKLIAGNIGLLAELQTVTLNHISNPEILKEACGAMWIMIAGNKGNRLWAGQSVLLQDLQRVMLKYPYDSALQRQVAEAVMHITAHEPENKSQAAGLELPKSLIVVMRAQSGSCAVETQVALCLATSHVCHQCLENKTQAKECGLLTHIEDLMRNSPVLQVKTAATTACKHMRLFTREPRPGEVSVDLEEIMRVGFDIQNIPTPGSKSSLLFSPRTTPGAVSKLQRTFQSVRVVSKLQMGLSHSSKDLDPTGESPPYQSPQSSLPTSSTGG